MGKVEAQADESPSLVIFPNAGMGHLIPLAEFAKRVVSLHSFKVIFIIPTLGDPSKAFESVLHSLPPSISHILLPPVNCDDLPEGTEVETIISLTVTRSLPSLRRAFRSLVLQERKLAGFVVDIFATDAIDVGNDFNIPSYIFYTSNAMALSVSLYLPKLDSMVVGEYRDLSEPVTFPGCIPIKGKYLPGPLQDRKNDAYKWTLHHKKRYALADGIMVNSFVELEPNAMKALLVKEDGKPPVYAVGPLVNADPSSGSDDSECVKWLDEQACGSVLFVSFGSGGTLSSAQINELAMGLEMSEQRFLWVVRSPSDEAANASYFSAQSQTDPFNFLPEGFLARTKERGKVVSSWAPQPQILRHGAVGGFLTHCGWNSVLESVVNGVPLIAWPLFAEQKMNAVMLTQDIKIALSADLDSKLVSREEISKLVKALLDGEEGRRIRIEVKRLKDEAGRVLSKDGPSEKVLSELATKWKNQVSHQDRKYWPEETPKKIMHGACKEHQTGKTNVVLNDLVLKDC